MAFIALAFFGFLAYFIIRNSSWVIGQDANAYYLAGERLLNGEPLYLDSAALDRADFYRYAPWFAAAFIPLTLAPREIAVTAFSLFALGCTAFVLWPLVRPLSVESLALLMLIAPPLINFSYLGNIQAPLVAAIMYLPGRWIWIAVAASLKFTPLALAIPDLMRGRWRQAAGCLALTVVLVAPILAFDLDRYPTGSAGQIGTWEVSPLLTVGVSVLAFLCAAIVSRRSYSLGMAAAAGATIVASPYLILGYLSWLAIPVRLSTDSRATPEVRATGYESAISGEHDRS